MFESYYISKSIEDSHLLQLIELHGIRSNGLRELGFIQHRKQSGFIQVEPQIWREFAFRCRKIVQGAVMSDGILNPGGQGHVPLLKQGGDFPSHASPGCSASPMNVVNGVVGEIEIHDVVNLCRHVQSPAGVFLISMSLRFGS